MQKDPIVVLSYARTPIGKMLGVLKDFSAVQLGSVAIQDALNRIKLAPDAVEAVFMGCVLQAGLKQVIFVEGITLNMFDTFNELKLTLLVVFTF